MTIISPSGGLPNLPNSVRVVDATNDFLKIRVFGHQLQVDPGNIRQKVYDGPMDVFVHVETLSAE